MRPWTAQRRTRRAWIGALPLLLGLVFIATIGLTAPSDAPLRRAWAATNGAVAQRLPGSQVAAIQAVIQRANDEQARALIGGDPAPMRATATAAYYRRLAQTNQALAAQGAASITLTRRSWGDVTVTGSTATATTTETWSMTFGDGTAAEFTDTYVYTLVQQGDAWLIAADQQLWPASTEAEPGDVDRPTDAA